MSAVKKILCIKLRALGDAAIWTAALNSLRAQFPEAEIHVLTWDSNHAILQNHPAVNRLHLIKKSRLALLLALWRMRSLQFDFLLGFHATTSLCRWAWIAGAKQMVLHHHSWPWTPQGSLPLAEPGKLEDTILRDQQVLRAIGITKSANTSIHITVEENRIAQDRTKNLWQNKKPVLALLPGAAAHLRRYPRDLWLRLIEQLQNENSYNILVLADQSLADDWKLDDECRARKIPLFADISLREYLAVLKQAHVAVANDSGPLHMAVALGLKTVAVFGPGCVGDWHPYKEKAHRLLWQNVDCRAEGPQDKPQFQFCRVQSCSHHKCMRSIAPASIAESIRILS